MIGSVARRVGGILLGVIACHSGVGTSPIGMSTSGAMPGSEGRLDGSTASETGTTSESGAEGDPDAELLAEIKAIVAPLVDPAGTPRKAVGIVVGAATPDRSWVVPLGRQAIGGSPVTAESIFEIGSVTKLWTGYLLARAEQQDLVSREDTVGATMAAEPTFAGQPITLLDLATHTSGLPTWPPNLPMPLDPDNPAAQYDQADLAQLLDTITLGAAPGTSFRYSNLGAGLLGEILRRRFAAPSFGAMIDEQLGATFGLTDTFVEPAPAHTSRLVQGYALAEAKPANAIGAPLMGAGALRSTVTDQLRFFQAALGDDPVWAVVRTPLRPSPFGADGYTGFMLTVDEGAPSWLYSKNGQTAGFASQVVFTLDPPVVVVIMANAAELSLVEPAQEILDAVARR